MSGYGGHSYGGGYYQQNAYPAPAANQHRGAPYGGGGRAAPYHHHQQQQQSLYYNAHGTAPYSKAARYVSAQYDYTSGGGGYSSATSSSYGPIRNPPRSSAPYNTASAGYYNYTKPAAKPAAMPAVKQRTVSLTSSQSKPVAPPPAVPPPSEENGAASRLASVVVAKKIKSRQSQSGESSRKLSDSSATPADNVTSADSTGKSSGTSGSVLKDIDTNKPVSLATSSAKPCAASCTTASTFNKTKRSGSRSTEIIELISPKPATASETTLSKRNSGDKIVDLVTPKPATASETTLSKRNSGDKIVDLVTPKPAAATKSALSKRISKDKSSVPTTTTTASSSSSPTIDLTTPARGADSAALLKSTVGTVIVTPAATPRLESVRNRVAAVMTPAIGRQYMVTPGQDYALTPDSVVPAAQSFSRSSLYYYESEISLHESNTVEFKAAGGGNAHGNYHRDVFPDHVDRYVSGFLNSQKGGLLMLGVADNGRVVGMYAPPGIQRYMEDILRDRLFYFTPKINSKYYQFTFKPVYFRNGRPMQDLYVAVLEVFPLTASADLTTIFETKQRRAYMKCDGSVQEMTVQKIVEHVKASYDLVLKDRLSGKT